MLCKAVTRDRWAFSDERGILTVSETKFKTWNICSVPLIHAVKFIFHVGTHMQIQFTCWNRKYCALYCSYLFYLCITSTLLMRERCFLSFYQPYILLTMDAFPEQRKLQRERLLLYTFCSNKKWMQMYLLCLLMEHFMGNSGDFTECTGNGRQQVSISCFYVFQFDHCHCTVTPSMFFGYLGGFSSTLISKQVEVLGIKKWFSFKWGCSVIDEILGFFLQVKDVMKNIMAGLQQTNSEKILLSWVRQSTRNYPQVNVINFTSSWSDGLAFNALLHSHR